MTSSRFIDFTGGAVPSAGDYADVFVGIAPPTLSEKDVDHLALEWEANKQVHEQLRRVAEIDPLSDPAYRRCLQRAQERLNQLKP